VARRTESEILNNSKARRDYHILEVFEAGVVLRGTEVKALRSGLGQIRDAFGQVENGEVWLVNAHIDEYSHGNRLNHDPKGRRKLLLRRPEIRKLMEWVGAKGNTLVPLSMYWKGNRVKVALGVGKGKAEYDKRQSVRTREAERELQRAVQQRQKRG
jgi:SsrA-binding protein